MQSWPIFRKLLIALLIIWGVVAWGWFFWDVINAIIHPPGPIPYK